MIFQFTSNLFQFGLMLLFLNIEASAPFNHYILEQPSPTRTIYGHVCAGVQSASMVSCAISCSEKPSCQLFVHTEPETCTCFSSFATQAMPDGSTQIFGSPKYFVHADSTTIYTYDPVSKVTFYVYGIKKKWRQAKKICLADGARLISFNPTEKRQVSNHIAKGGYWIGLTDINVEGKWTWSSNAVFKSKGWRVSFNNYDENVAGAGQWNADCGVWNPNRIDRLFDANCGQLNYFICEKYV